MIHRVVNYIQKHDDQLKEIARQRKIWVCSSIISLTLIVLLVFLWDLFPKEHNITATITSLSLILISIVNWGFWTLRIFKKFLVIKDIELALIRSVVLVIKEIKKDLSTSSNIDPTNKK